MCDLVLAQSDYFSSTAFLNYLQYLKYWQQPEYARFILYVLNIINYKNRLILIFYLQLSPLFAFSRIITT
jgi:hypothetical protein